MKTLSQYTQESPWHRRSALTSPTFAAVATESGVRFRTGEPDVDDRARERRQRAIRTRCDSPGSRSRATATSIPQDGSPSRTRTPGRDIPYPTDITGDSLADADLLNRTGLHVSLHPYGDRATGEISLSEAAQPPHHRGPRPVRIMPVCVSIARPSPSAGAVYQLLLRLGLSTLARSSRRR